MTESQSYPRSRSSWSQSSYITLYNVSPSSVVTVMTVPWNQLSLKRRLTCAPIQKSTGLSPAILMFFRLVGIRRYVGIVNDINI